MDKIMYIPQVIHKKNPTPKQKNPKKLKPQRLGNFPKLLCLSQVSGVENCSPNG